MSDPDNDTLTTDTAPGINYSVLLAGAAIGIALGYYAAKALSPCPCQQHADEPAGTWTDASPSIIAADGAPEFGPTVPPAAFADLPPVKPTAANGNGSGKPRASTRKRA